MRLVFAAAQDVASQAQARRLHRTLPLRHALAIAVTSIGLAGTSAVDARVTRITFQTTTAVANAGPVGPYEQLRGEAEGELDPLDRRNALITDIQFAPRNANGKVTYTTQFTLLKPVDMSKAGGILMEVIPNRGGIANPYGTDLLFAYGEVVLNVAWQGDIPITATTGDLGINVPRAVGVVGRVWDRFIAPSGLQVNLPEVAGRQLATMDTTQAKLISFASETPEGVKTDVVLIPSTDFAFASCTAANPFPGTPSATQLCVKGGFQQPARVRAGAPGQGSLRPGRRRGGDARRDIVLPICGRRRFRHCQSALPGESSTRSISAIRSRGGWASTSSTTASTKTTATCSVESSSTA